MWSMSTASMKRVPPRAARRGEPEATSQAPSSEARSPTVVSAFGVSGVCRSGRTRTRASRTSQGLTEPRSHGTSRGPLPAAEELAQAPQRLAEAREPIGVGEAKIPLAAGAEIDARRHRDAGPGQDLEREVVRALAKA